MGRGLVLGLSLAGGLAVAILLVVILAAGVENERAATGEPRVVRELAADTAGVAAVERAAAARLESQEPLVGAPARETFCAIELSAADGALDRGDGRVVRAWGWASCQQVRPGSGRRLVGGAQSSEPVRVILTRTGSDLDLRALEAPQQGLDYEASMAALFPKEARRVVDGVSGAAFDARIDRLLCANLAAAGERFGRPGATLVGQGERCPE